MMKLEQYLRAQRGRAAIVAMQARVAQAFLWAIAKGARPCPVKLAVRIERITLGEVSRRDLFPDDWWEYWPDMPGAEEAQSLALVSEVA